MNCSVKNKLKISVAMSVYKNDNAKHFEQSLNSIILGQTLVPDEIVLVVDGSVTEEIDEVIDKYKASVESFKVIRLDKNYGLGNALKLAVENSSYEIIARMDSDDISVPTRLEEQIKYFYNNDVDIVGGDIAEFFEEENKIEAYRKVPKNDNEIKDYMKTRCPFNHVSVMFKKKSVLDSGNYKDLLFNEDYYLWIRMAEKGCKMMNTGTVLVNVRVDKNTYKRRGGKKYFKSEYFLQKYMLERRLITKWTYTKNVFKRFIVQVIMPNNMRALIFKLFARERG